MSNFRLRLTFAIAAGVVAGSGLWLLWQAAGWKAAAGAFLVLWANNLAQWRFE